MAFKVASLQNSEQAIDSYAESRTAATHSGLNKKITDLKARRCTRWRTGAVMPVEAKR